MNGAVFGLGLLTELIGVLLLLVGSRSGGEMEIDLGKFKGPVWFLLIVLGIFINLTGLIIP